MITNPNELLDATFSSRSRFFHKQVVSMGEDKANRVVWARVSATDHDVTDNKEESTSGFSAGTFRRNSISASNVSSSQLGSFTITRLFNLSRKSSPDCFGKDQSTSRSASTSLSAQGGHNTRKKFEVRRPVFRRTSISSNDLEVERI